MDLGFRPRLAKGGQVLPRIAVQQQLIMNGLIDPVWVLLLLWKLPPFERLIRLKIREEVVTRELLDGLGKRHGKCPGVTGKPANGVFPKVATDTKKPVTSGPWSLQRMLKHG